VNESYHEFAVVPDGDNRKAPIRFGMDAIKNVGTGAVEEILRARQLDDGGFGSLEDFLAKTSVRIVNRKPLESLVKAGALDRFGDRSQLLHNLDLILAYANRLQKEANSGQVDLFGGLGDDAAAHKPQLSLEKSAASHNSREKLLWERELLGLYLSEHPLAMYEAYLAEQTMSLGELTPAHDGRPVTVGGAIVEAREIATKNGQRMAFVKLEDQFGGLELILFPSVYQQTIGLWERDRVILVRGKVSAKTREGVIGEEVKIMVDDAREITAEQAEAYQATGRKLKIPTVKKPSVSAGPKKDAPNEKRMFIRLSDSNDQKLLLALKQTIDKHPGETEVVLVLGPPDSKQIIKLPAGIARTDALMGQLRELVGAENIK
jgi:DNA polymerase-3 subunit alpha